MPGAIVIKSSNLLATSAGAGSTRPQIAQTARLPLSLHPSFVHAARLPRLVAVRASSVDTTPEPERPSSPETQGPLHAVGQFGAFAIKLVVDAWSLVQRLIELVQRVRIAAEAIKASANSGSAPPSAPLPVNATASASPAAPLQLLSAATMGAVTHLRHTLTDATSTLEVKWRALETTAGDRMGGLFTATKDSAAALDALQATTGDAASRLWSQNSTAAVVQEEEALRRQVFAQVYAELNAQARRSGGNAGYSPA